MQEKPIISVSQGSRGMFFFNSSQISLFFYFFFFLIYLKYIYSLLCTPQGRMTEELVEATDNRGAIQTDLIRPEPIANATTIKDTGDNGANNSNTNITLDGQTPETNQETNQELPAFSFSKKPIDHYIKRHSHISDILPNDVNNKTLINNTQDQYNDIDYNEQIRAPRINFKNSNNSLSGLMRSEAKSGSITISSSDSTNRHNSVDNSGYIPANFDLTKTINGFATSNDDLYDQNYTYNNPNETTPSQLDLQLQSQHNESNDNLKAIKNLNDNLTSEERKVGSNSNSNSSTNLKQVYKLKRPLSIPAVLRPNNIDQDNSPAISNSNANSNKTSIDNSLDDNLSCNNLSFKINDDYSAVAPGNLESNFEPIEPTHSHWKPNDFTNYCMKCFTDFGNFFNRKRRHHCRFCGFIVCSNCLININDENFNNLIYLDKGSRFVIPIFKNLINLNLSVKSLANYFKLCKICKNCGEHYLDLLYNLNNLNSNLNLPFVFIENPYLNKNDLVIKNNDRLNSIPNTNVPTDWTWSSF